MLQPKSDPFFEELKADVLDGIAASDRGETHSEEEVWEYVAEVVRDTKRDEP